MTTNANTQNLREMLKVPEGIVRLDMDICSVNACAGRWLELRMGPNSYEQQFCAKCGVLCKESIWSREGKRAWRVIVGKRYICCGGGAEGETDDNADVVKFDEALRGFWNKVEAAQRLSSWGAPGILISQEVAEILAARLPREIGAIVMGFLQMEVGQVAVAFRAVVKEISWDIEEESYFLDNNQRICSFKDETKVLYQSGLEKYVWRCRKCGTIEVINYNVPEYHHDALLASWYWECADNKGCAEKPIVANGEEPRVFLFPKGIRFREWDETAGVWMEGTWPEGFKEKWRKWPEK